MGAPTNYYVDPGSGNDTTGDGSISTPWATMQHALDTITHDESNGVQINLKAGTSDLLTTTLDFTTYGATYSFSDPLIIRGYTSAANDGGIGVLDMQGNNNSIISSSTGNGLHLIDLEFTNSGTATLVSVSNQNYSSITGCVFHNTTGTGLYWDGGRTPCITNCRFYNIGTYGIHLDSAASEVVGNWFQNGTNSFTNAIYADTGTAVFLRNIISIDGASNGIVVNNDVGGSVVRHNSILSSSGTGKGIQVQDSNTINTIIDSNLVEGFSGAGGVGIDLSSVGRNIQRFTNNAVYNCTTAYSTTVELNNQATNDNESLGSSPFAKSGSDTYANRLTYFEPNDVGNVIGGAFQ